MYMCALHDFVPPTVWIASLNKQWRLKQSIQLVHVPLSSWHNAVLRTQLGKMCYYSITHSSAPPSFQFTNHLTTHCFIQCAMYTFLLHSIHWTVGHVNRNEK